MYENRWTNFGGQTVTPALATQFEGVKIDICGSLLIFNYCKGSQPGVRDGYSDFCVVLLYFHAQFILC